MYPLLLEVQVALLLPAGRSVLELKDQAFLLPNITGNTHKVITGKRKVLQAPLKPQPLKTTLMNDFKQNNKKKNSSTDRLKSCQ